MVVVLTVSYDITLEISDEKAFRADAIDELGRADAPEGPEYPRQAIADARTGGWNFIQELLLIHAILPDLAGVTSTDETVSRPTLLKMKS